MESPSSIAFKKYVDRALISQQIIEKVLGVTAAHDFLSLAMSDTYDGDIQVVKPYLEEFYQMHGANLQVRIKAFLTVPHEGFPRDAFEVLELAQYRNLL
ncbi:hypothetical protein [Ewingella americana]|uniref:Uncharacterized protein n=1 Tax=Ewingella americana TaxID=41202 RepID=A0A502GE15_9GAMM|nr:hypothetical protein [Ewingella americana]TPG59991.1 hypothetical protein EAH77_15605 [Ewingella americana]